MAFAAKVIVDSISRGVRLTTLEVTFPRFVLAEFNTHRVFSRNSASSRAIPVERRLRMLEDDPFVPAAFALNKRGMQAGDELDERDNSKAQHVWVKMMRAAISGSEELLNAGVHKQWANRLTEPFAWHTVVVTSTEWENFFSLRCSAHAQPEMRTAAEMMRDAMRASTPVEKLPGAWHLPYVEGVDDHAFDARADRAAQQAKVSTARCARVSYLTHDGKRNVEADIDLYERLISARHMSPFEHPAQAAPEGFPLRHEHFYFGVSCVYCGAIGNREMRGTVFDDREPCAPLFIGNFRSPWIQYRKRIPGEAIAPPDQSA